MDAVVLEASELHTIIEAVEYEARSYHSASMLREAIALRKVAAKLSSLKGVAITFKLEGIENVAG